MTAILDLLLVLALLFFLFLPITGRRTVIMRLSMMAVIAALFAGSITKPQWSSLVGRVPQDMAMSSN
ncbi:MAG TPA: hypothetical protein VFR21_19890 [Bradyrhizobium sp.]|nr:hypothetical protein [Bradyrhizobium sp.]